MNLLAFVAKCHLARDALDILGSNPWETNKYLNLVEANFTVKICETDA